MQQTYEMNQAAMPTRHEKRRVANQLGHLNESTIYKWCEDPARAGTKHNWIDVGVAVLEHSAVHHPEAALTIVRHLESVVTDILVDRAEGLRPSDIVANLQPRSEKELLDVVQAFSGALRQAVLSNNCDLDSLLREVNEAEVAMRRARVMIQAVLAEAGSERQ